ncbi:MAG: pyridine nucleotide-disulfide oxidoreductase [Burkholderiales bacterium RIFCSPHIGHO2_12_FULL_67_38]|nr:MAG: pyridine nucleotide-disulfide oxidoreductase [Burkholderiales bacterium RIFCSPLOWO2_02_FULL_67_64]OGB50036.1 MAG: pyridine nucleotide-disulfide oxidoreductase [Burkholderiales bacterium RIFCSPHIGHO2_12_FULL_67_38]OGB80604.1 MAG: pyridine nucleotide-disulfide oxidoreductase [Burkholderiales bacterium RIFCSPLOWO2_12_FULL_67_210]
MNVETSAAGIVIVGTGQAGVMTAEALRSGGFEGSITLLGDEPHGPYHRPPLSKAWMAGEMDAAQLVMRAPEMLARKNIALRTGVTVKAIDRSAQTVILGDGSALPYTGLMLATGSTPRALPLPGGDAPGVLALRTRDDASAIADRLAACIEQQRPVVVIGGGFIGLEVAATARKKGLTVTVLEAAPRLLGRVLAPVLSDWYAELHRGHGVQLVLGAQVAAIEADAQGVTGVKLADGSVVPAGLVVVGIGVNANDQLAQAAGLECERGIVVDACGRTSDPLIVAAGDCTARRMADGSLLRLESVQNATEQGKSAAAALLGQDRPFTATPWFWSDQYDKKLQMAGLSVGADGWAVRGDMAAGTFTVYHFKGEQLIAADSVNASKDHLLVRKLLDAGVSPTREQAGNVGFDLASLLSRSAIDGQPGLRP